MITGIYLGLAPAIADTMAIFSTVNSASDGPQVLITVDDEIYSKNKAAIIWTIKATNTGPGIYPPTGKKINVQGMSIYHFTNGKIFDEWIAGNNLLWYQQLGFTLTPPVAMKK